MLQLIGLRADVENKEFLQKKTIGKHNLLRI